MRYADHAIAEVSKVSKRAILFHSASGKDSIALLDLMAPKFEQVVCVYMYAVRDLSHINRYINYAVQRYPNVRFIQVPHFALSSFIKTGAKGHYHNPDQRLYSLADITEEIRQHTGIEWAFFGFKQSDSMNRRLMLRGYEQEAINFETKKCYPLSKYKNRDIIGYIKRNGLVMPEKYGKGQSSGTNVTDINYLLFLRNNYPGDLKKVFASFPEVERLLFEYDYKQEQQEATKTE